MRNPGLVLGSVAALAIAGVLWWTVGGESPADMEVGPVVDPRVVDAPVKPVALLDPSTASGILEEAREARTLVEEESPSVTIHESTSTEPHVLVGRVENELGDPQANVDIQLGVSGVVSAANTDMWVPIPGSWTKSDRDGGFEMPIPRLGPDGLFELDEEMMAIAQVQLGTGSSDGLLSVDDRTSLKKGTLAVRANRRSLKEQIQVDLPESRQMVIRLPTIVEVTGSVVLPTGIPRRDLTAWLIPQGSPSATAGPTTRALEHRDSINVAGRFRFRSVSPGFWRCEIRAECPDPVFTVDGIQVVAGQTTSDPRIQRIDLASRMRIAVIEVFDSTGTKLPGTRVLVRSRDPLRSKWMPAKALEDGRFGVVLVASSVEALIRCPGYRARMVDDVWNDVRVTLEKGRTLRVVVLGEIGGESSDHLLAIAIEPESPSPLSEGSPNHLGLSRLLGKNRECLFDLPCDGRWVIRWLGIRRSGSTTSTVVLGDAATVDVQGAGDEIILELTPPPEVLEMLRQPRAEVRELLTDQ